MADILARSGVALSIEQRVDVAPAPPPGTSSHPCPLPQPRPRSASAWSGVSTPLAVTARPSERAMARTPATMRLSPAVAPRPGSILSTSTSHCSRQRIDESPAPKASMATPTPSARIAASFSWAVGRSWSRAASVISRHRERGSTPVGRDARPQLVDQTDLGELGRRQVDPHRRADPRACRAAQRAAWAHASLDDPVADVDDEPRVLGDVDEALGGEHLARRLTPSQQGLDRLDPTGRRGRSRAGTRARAPPARGRRGAPARPAAARRPRPAGRR